jgi:hypothetical protein
MAVSAELTAQSALLRSQGLTYAEIGAVVGLGVYQIRRALKTGPAVASWWTPERDAEASRHYLAGATLVTIAEKIGAPSKSAVIGRLRRLGVMRPEEVNAANRSAGGQRAAARTNAAVSPDLAWWTPARDAEAERLLLSGMSFKDIAVTMGATSKNAVIGRMHRRGVVRPKPAAPARAQSTPRPAVAAKSKPVRIPTPKPASWREPVVKLVSARPAPAVAAVFAPPNPRPFEERRRNQCAWPIDQADGSMLACCEPISGQRWCENHTVIGSRPVRSHKATAYQRRATGFDFRRLA